VAIKVTHAGPCVAVAVEELDLLKRIHEEDSKGASRCASMYEGFWHEEHFCIVFEVLGISLRDLLHHNALRGCWLQDVQAMSRDIIEALRFLHALTITHADIKPANILLESREAAHQDVFPREGHWRKTSSSALCDDCPYFRPVNNRVKTVSRVLNGEATRTKCT